MVNMKSPKTTEPKRSTHVLGVDKLWGTHADTRRIYICEKFPRKYPFFSILGPGKPKRPFYTSPRSVKAAMATGMVAAVVAVRGPTAAAAVAAAAAAVVLRAFMLKGRRARRR